MNGEQFMIKGEQTVLNEKQSVKKGGELCGKEISWRRMGDDGYTEDGLLEKIALELPDGYSAGDGLRNGSGNPVKRAGEEMSGE